jgi:hypothetical protein
LLVGGGCLAAAAFLPVNLPNWQYFSMRFSPMGVVLLGVLLPLERLTSARARAGARLAFAAYAFAAVAWAGWYNRALAAGAADALAGLDAPVRRHGPRLDVVTTIRPMSLPLAERPIPYLIPFWNLGPLYAVAQGGVPPRLFASLAMLHHLERRPAVPYPEHPLYFPAEDLASPARRGDSAYRSEVITQTLMFAADYEDVIFYGEPSDVPQLRARGFELDFERGGLAIARFVGCPLTVSVEPAPTEDGPKRVEAHWSPFAPPVVSVILPRAAQPAPATVEIPRSPCGEVWVRVLYDTDGNGVPSVGDRVCHGARADGFVRVAVPRGGARFECRPGPQAGR